MQVLNADESGSYNIAGTSAATALATSGAALLQMVTDDVLAPEDIQGALRAVARDIEADHALPGVTLTGYDKYTGAGECRVAPAVSALAAGRLIQCRTAAGVATLGDPQLGVWTIPPLNLDAQLCYAYEATADVTFPAMVATPSVWGVGRWTGGTSLSNPNYGEGWCEVMPGSLSATGCTLRTYLLKLVIGWPVVELWWPCAPEDLTFGYTILGEVSVSGMPETAPSRAQDQSAVSSVQRPRSLVEWCQRKTNYVTGV
ncbi:MAG: hypothetical protein IPK72_11890 [Candidatus Eisenbacteria bacterium]|nr:hypothetical protein [Candidatus Eisenbacteria bacterium]